MVFKKNFESNLISADAPYAKQYKAVEASLTNSFQSFITPKPSAKKPADGASDAVGKFINTATSKSTDAEFSHALSDAASKTPDFNSVQAQVNR